MLEDVRRFAVKHSYLFAYIRYFWTEYFKAGGGGGPVLSTESPQWTDARLALDGFIRLSEEQGITEGHQSAHVNMEEMESVTYTQIKVV